MSFLNPTVADFKNYFVRDFPYGTDPSTSVLDADIAKAYGLTNINFNQNFWADQNSYTIGYLLLSAHYLVMDLRASSQGISGQFSWLQSSKSVGSVSEGLSIPERIMNNPELAILTKTNYGTQYLFLLLPQLTGQIFTVLGTTRTDAVIR